MKRFLARIAAYGIIVFIILNAIALLSLWLIGRSTLHKPQFVKNAHRASSFDYVVLGSSTGLTTLDTKLIDSITGKRGLNISMDDSGLSSHFLMLEHFYKVGKKTNCLVLAITPWDMAVANPPINDNDYRFLSYVQEKYVYDYYSTMEKPGFKVLSFSRYFPIIGVSYYNIELFYPSILCAIRPNQRNRFDDRGNYSYPVVVNALKKVHETITLVDKNPFLKKIEQFCIEKKIELILYQSPIFNTTVLSNADKGLINHSDLLRDGSQFYDDIHVNIKGRRICSENVAGSLSKK